MAIFARLLLPLSLITLFPPKSYMDEISNMDVSLSKRPLLPKKFAWWLQLNIS